MGFYFPPASLPASCREEPWVFISGTALGAFLGVCGTLALQKLYSSAASIKSCGKGTCSALREISQPRGVGFDSVGPTQATADGTNRLLRKAETVISRRTSQILLVIERSNDSHNYSACIRTAEALGIQHVWCIDPPDIDRAEKKRASRKKSKRWNDDAADNARHSVFAKNAAKWITLRIFVTTEECLAALRAEHRQVWVTDLSQRAVSLRSLCASAPLPSRLAICLGSELSGASAELLQAADKRVYLPLHGFADSLNLSVAGALVMHTLLEAEGGAAVGAMEDGERQELRRLFYPRVGRTEEQKAHFGEYAERVNRSEAEVQPFADLRRADAHRKDQGAIIA